MRLRSCMSFPSASLAVLLLLCSQVSTHSRAPTHRCSERVFGFLHACLRFCVRAHARVSVCVPPALLDVSPAVAHDVGNAFSALCIHVCLRASRRTCFARSSLSDRAGHERRRKHADCVSILCGGAAEDRSARGCEWCPQRDGRCSSGGDRRAAPAAARSRCVARRGEYDDRCPLAAATIAAPHCRAWQYPFPPFSPLPPPLLPLPPSPF
jgi:hypothetical protein